MTNNNQKMSRRTSYLTTEASREYGRKYYAKNKEKLLKRMAAYRVANKELVAAGHKKSHAKWYAKNRAKVLLKCRTKSYGVSSDKIVELLSGPCSICGNGSAHIDHDHKSNRVRGALCKHCNWALGHFKDSVDNLRKAIEYLTLHSHVDA